MSRQLWQPRLAEMVADVLRDRIVQGAFEDNGMLPKQETLVSDFGVSKPSLREALRILEAEGLITVRRGNMGGATVHAPRINSAAYTIGLILKSRDVDRRDLSTALTELEPLCAALCANRPDRLATVVPALEAAHAQMAASVDDRRALTLAARRFHECFVRDCGNETMVVIVGALELLWSEQETDWASTPDAETAFADTGNRERSIADHDDLLEAIRAGRADETARLTREHLKKTIFFAASQGDTTPLRAPAPRRAPTAPL
jgi:DNA-binding FadR family transcriptional regulator